ncbi:hypothetical protein M436DRAFT_76750 [Aureobasidium namibiae CBS 147.97]|uniref:F-box domain-containing protein n=1 Tax=Aureobasidium namibiae CBS 147.97 TaxID=1043004 RepID=A0A074W6B3_9PEZI
MATSVYLPVEILSCIIWFTIPDHNYLAYPASHITTKSLVALLTVSRATSRIAKTLLYTHCLYIDTPWRLDTLLTASLANPRLPVLLSSIQNLYLAPFPGRMIRDRKIINQITELFTLLGPSLKRLIINMPLRSHYPFEDVTEKLRPILRQGFEQLVHLEEFCSVRDELYLAYWDPDYSHIIPDLEDYDFESIHYTINDYMFERWPKLRLLALYNGLYGRDLKNALGRMPRLEQIVLSRPDFDESFVHGAWSSFARWHKDRFRFTLIESTDDASDVGLQKLTLGDQPPENQPDVWKYKAFVEEDKDPISSVQKWSMQRMLDGSLWSLADHARPSPAELEMTFL